MKGFPTGLSNVAGHQIGYLPRTSQGGPRCELQILQEIEPEVKRVGILWNASDPAKASEAEKTQAAAEALGLTAKAYDVRAPEGFAKAFAAMRADGIEALLLIADSFMIFHRELIAGFAAAERIPATYPFREFGRPAA